jgi:hypothetical protein
MRHSSTVAAVLLVQHYCTALLAPQAAPRTQLRAVRIEGLLDEAVITQRTNTHRCLKELRKKGAVADALATNAVVRSQFGDPLATGAADAIKINNVLSAAITETDVPDYDGENATQSWRLKRGPLRLEGLTKVSFDDDGCARTIELGVSNVNGLEVDATSAQARQALVGFLGGASSERYNAVADFGQRALASTLSLVSTASSDDDEEVSEEAIPDASKLGDAAFDAYVTVDAAARGALKSLEVALGRDDAKADAAARDACSSTLRVYGLAGEAVAGLDGDLDAVLRTLRAARGARSTLESTNALEKTTASVRTARADVGARTLEATVVIEAVPSPGGAFLAAALGLRNATVIEADVVYDLDDLATAVTLEALRVDGRALEAPNFYKWASAARAALAPAAPQIKPAAPPAKKIGEPAAVAVLRAADALHSLPDMLIVGGLTVDAWLDRAGVSDNVVATAGPAPLFRGRRALGDALRAAKALLALGPTATCAVERVCIERDRSLVVKMTLARPALPDIVLIVRLTVDGAVNAIDTTSVTVGGAELSPKALTDALDRARALATARRDLASLFRGGGGD